MQMAAVPLVSVVPERGALVLGSSQVDLDLEHRECFKRGGI